MDGSKFVSVKQRNTLQQNPSPANTAKYQPDSIYSIAYMVALVISIFIWFLAIRAPLWLDETGSYWHIYKGFSQIWPSNFQCPETPAYDYFLWLGTKMFGSSEVALRIPSLLAMLGAAYLLFLSARELFERDIAFIATIIFCLNPMIVFASVDARPYAFGMLAVNVAILCLLRMRHNQSAWLAALLGFSCAAIFYFHFLLGAVLPALLLGYFVIADVNRKGQWRQLGIALAVFAVAILPAIPSFLFTFHSSDSHVFEAAPTLLAFLGTFAPVKFVPTAVSIAITFYASLVLAFAFAVVLTHNRLSQIKIEKWQIAVCALLALVPVLLLFGVSKGTSIHIFATRHRIEAASGIALCWALLFTQVKNRTARLILCLVLVAAAAYQGYSNKGQHLYSWKDAIEAVEKNASVDNAPVLICSDFPESDYVPMPLDAAKESPYFAQLSYYKLSVPVVPLPRALNYEAKLVASDFYQFAVVNHQRFLAMGYAPSYATLDWLAGSAAGQYSVRVLGNYEGVLVLEFDPREQAAAR